MIGGNFRKRLIVYQCNEWNPSDRYRELINAVNVVVGLSVEQDSAAFDDKYFHADFNRVSSL